MALTIPVQGYFINSAISLAERWSHHANPLSDAGNILLFSGGTVVRLLEEGGFCVSSFGGVGHIPYLWTGMLIVVLKERSRDGRDRKGWS